MKLLVTKFLIAAIALAAGIVLWKLGTMTSTGGRDTAGGQLAQATFPWQKGSTLQYRLIPCHFIDNQGNG